MELRRGVVNVFPVSRLPPPLALENQYTVPEEGVAPIVTVPGPQVPEGEVELIVGNAITVTVTAVRGEETQLNDCASA